MAGRACLQVVRSGELLRHVQVDADVLVHPAARAPGRVTLMHPISRGCTQPPLWMHSLGAPLGGPSVHLSWWAVPSWAERWQLEHTVRTCGCPGPVVQSRSKGGGAHWRRRAGAAVAGRCASAISDPIVTTCATRASSSSGTVNSTTCARAG